MNRVIAISGVALACVIGFSVRAVLRRNRSRRARQDAYAAWSRADHDVALRRLIDAEPDNPVGRYLLGCSQLRSGRIKEAARSFGMAYHQNVEIESAALMTFACLKAKDGVSDDLLDQMAITWREMGEPRLQDSSADRGLLGALEASETPAGLSMLGRLAWAIADEQGRSSLLASSQGASDVRRPLFEVSA